MKSKERHRHSGLALSAFVACQSRTRSAFTSQRYATSSRRGSLAGGGSIFRRAQVFTSPMGMVGDTLPSLFPMQMSESGSSLRTLSRQSIPSGRPVFGTFRPSSPSATVSSSTLSSSSSAGWSARITTTLWLPSAQKLRIDYGSMTLPNHALQRTRRERRSCNQCVPCAGSLSLGR